jgi:phospho-N-acetylmuramoyl-pentapeptide-transferase
MIWQSLSLILLSFILSFVFIKIFLSCKDRLIQPIRYDGPQSHLESKNKTPTMGGVGIFLAIILATFIQKNYLGLVFSPEIWAILAIFTIFFLVGFVDDLLKVRNRSHYGLKGKPRILLQLISTSLVLAILHYGGYTKNLTILYFPLLNWSFDLGFLYYVFAFFVVVGSANAVNLTDGLDGLVSFPLIIALLSLAFMARDAILINICFIAVGAILAFLLFNFHPAKIFMGDSGSVSLGALIGFIAIVIKQEIIFAVISGLFIIEAMSVIIQVLYYKSTKKRFFLMAPLHHHFEKKGWIEKKVVFVFWGFSLLFASLGLMLF